MTVGFMRLPVAAGNDWWAVMFGCSVMFGCLLRHARLRPGISYDYASPTNLLPVTGNLWKEFFQDRQVHPEHSSELLVGGVVAKVHLAGGVDLLLGVEL